jgi:Ca2+-binding RTX toxin-like protein
MREGQMANESNPILGVGEIAFADGVTWDSTDIAWAVAPNTDGVDGTLIGTDAMDVLDGGCGNHVLSGGDGGDVYLYDRGDGADTIDVNKTNVLIASPSYLRFGPGDLSTGGWRACLISAKSLNSNLIQASSVPHGAYLC